MKLTQWFLLLLKRLVSSPNRVLWWIWAFVRSRSSSQRPKKGDEDRRSTECRPAKSPPTVICASRSPSPLTPIAGDGTPIVSPTPISIQVRQPTILNLADIDYETHEDSLDEHPEHATIFVYRGVAGGARAENPNSTPDDAFHATVQPRRKRQREEVIESHGQGPANHSSLPLESDSCIKDSAGDPSDISDATLEDTSSSFEPSSSAESATPVPARVHNSRKKRRAFEATTSPLYNKLSLDLRLTTTSLPSDPRVLKLCTLANKLRHLFPEDAPHLSSILSNDQADEGGFVDPRGPKPRSEDKLIHVFVDYSNILIGFLSYLRRHPDVVAGCPTKHLSHPALVLILERGRSVTRRVLVTSSPLYQPMDSATQLGYEVQILPRVPDMGDGMDRKRKRNSARLGNTRTSPASGHARRESISSATMSENSDGANAGLLPTPARTQSVRATNTGSPAGKHRRSTRVRYREQGVDELLQDKLYQAIADVDAVPPNATIVLATGDGNVGQYSEEGFLGCVRTALEKGWKVELYAWERGLNRSWKREFGKGPHRRQFSIHGLGADTPPPFFSRFAKSLFSFSPPPSPGFRLPVSPGV